MKIVRKNEVEILDRPGYKTQMLLDYVFESSAKGLAPSKNIGVYCTTVKKGGKTKEQYHKKSWELIYFLDPAEARLAGKIHKFDKGDLVMLEPNEAHEILAVYGDVEVFAIRFPHDVEDKYYTE